MVHLFNRTIKNILHNFTPYEVITGDDRDPPWINSSIKRLIQAKNEDINALKEAIITANTLKIFNPFRIYLGFLLKRLRKNIIPVYLKSLWNHPQVPKHIGQY